MKKIVILHGWTYSLDKWQFFIQLLRSSGFEVEALKVPGLTEESGEVWDLEKYVDWLNRKIKTKVILLGHSNGGRISIAFASRYPERIEKLVLIDSAGIYHRGRLINLKRFIFGLIAKTGKRIINSDRLRKLLYKLARETDYAKATPKMRQTMINLINRDLTPELKKIKTPTLIIWGEDDKITPLADGKLMNSLINGSKLEIIEGARHSPYYTHSQNVLELIKNDI